MNLDTSIGRSFLRSLVSHPAGRAHILSLMVAAEEGDEVGVFEQLIRKVDDPELERSETYALTFASELEASMASVWEVVATMKGVNEELSPWLRMTAPPEARNLRIEDAPVGRPMFASWVLLGGVLPLDRHYFMLAQVEPGHGFEEDSTSWSQRRWEHRRHLEARGVGCVLTDRLTFTPRLRVSGPILARVIGAIFHHRHRLLRERFGGPQHARLSGSRRRCSPSR
jgi:hypothetical protein